MSGVSEYTVATVTVYFPKGHEKCALCPLLETYSRNQCRASGEYLIDTKVPRAVLMMINIYIRHLNN